MSAHLKQMIYRVSKDFVSNQIPEDASFFEPIWDAFKGMLDKWSDKHPTEWPSVSNQRRLLADVGFAGQGLDLLTPYILAIVSAAVLHLSGSGRKPNRRAIHRVVRTYVGKFHAPGAMEGQVRHLVPLIELELSRLRSSGVALGKRPKYVVIENGGDPDYVYTADELKKYWRRQERRPYEIYVDDTKPQLLLNGTPPKRLKPGETDAYLTLMCLLEKVGGFWTHEELILEGSKEVKPFNEWTFESKDSKRLDQRISYIKQVLKEAIDENDVDNFISTSSPRRVVIGSNLRTCLIRFAD